MRKQSYKSYIFLVVFLFMILSLPEKSVDPLRFKAIAAVAPTWRGFSFLKRSLFKLMVIAHHPSNDEELKRLKAENLILKKQIESYAEVRELLGSDSKLLPAKVIFREPDSWSSVLWINVGTKNKVAIGSPVMLGPSIIGMIEQVGEKTSKVRLITDPNLTPSVRALRGDSFLAKGELRGSVHPLWRMKSHIVQGVGFNYDFPDDKGGARNLRTGDILKVGDLLVTTGYDGVFPAGLEVGIVTKVEPLREGACSYNLEAHLSAGNLDDLNYLLVLPPLN